MTNSPKERLKQFITPSGYNIKRSYQASDLPRDLNQTHTEAGTFPYTRGLHQTMYRGKLWTMRQYAGFGSACETNQRFRYLISQGTTGLSVAFDLPTQMGRDSDHQLSKGEVGRVGVSICTVDDMEELLAEIPLDKVSISMTINSTAAILLAFLLVVAERRNVSWDKLNGTVQNDILKEYIARGTYIFPPRHALRIVTDIFSFAERNVPKWNTISVSGYHIREAGSNAIQELAFTFADAIAYLEASLAAGLSVDQVAPRISFFFNSHNDLLEEISKFRAARAIWARIMKERFKATRPESMMLRFHAQTAGSSLTAQQPLNNVVRTTVQALAAILGGTQSLHTNSFDEALGLPTEQSAGLALRTQQILAYESGVANSVDPLAGSYLIESWTSAIERDVLSELEKISKMGGMLSAIENGYPQGEIERTAYQYQRAIENKEMTVVGVNDFMVDEGELPQTQTIDPNEEARQIFKLTNIKSKRSKQAQENSIALLKHAASERVNLMPLIIDAARNEATLGEISDALRQVFGEYENIRV